MSRAGSRQRTTIAVVTLVLVIVASVSVAAARELDRPSSGTAVGQEASQPARAAEPRPADEALPLHDTVTTVELSETLSAWGSLGGIAVDQLGFVYVANFADAVWRVAPDGEVKLLADSLYGSSGNAVDAQGNLLQASFIGNTVSRIYRDGRVETIVSEGLSGPVGIAVEPDGGFVVCNCSGNSLVRVAPSGAVEPLASGPLFACPNGIVRTDDGSFYVVNFNTPEIVRVGPDGEATAFATIGTVGNAHVTLARGNLYVSKILTSEVWRVTLDGRADLIAGTGAPGHDDGPALEATLSSPNGIAASPAGDAIYVNVLHGERNSGERGSVGLRRVDLVTLADVLMPALEAGDLEAVASAYEAFKSDPMRAVENTDGEAGALAFRMLRRRTLVAATGAIELLRLNAESYPESAAAVFSLGEGYRYTGQTGLAIAAFERVLEIDPHHPNAAARIELLRQP